MKYGAMMLAWTVMVAGNATAVDQSLFADVEFTPRDIDPRDGVADCYVGGDPVNAKYLFIKAGTEDRACAEFGLGTLEPCQPVRARLHFWIRTLDDGVLPADPIELKAYEGNGAPDFGDFDPADGQVVRVFDGPIEDVPNPDPEGCPNFYNEMYIDVSGAVHAAMVDEWTHAGFVFRDTVYIPGEQTHRFDIYANTWGCAPPSNCCDESYISLELTYLTPGDGNGDEFVQLDDLPLLTTCLQAPQVALESGCQVMDLTCDGDVDLEDFAAFQRTASPQ